MDYKKTRKLFKHERPEKMLEFIAAETFETGLVQLRYERKK